MFVTNDKGSSWAYSTPGFGAPLAPALLKELREMARVPEQSRFYTEVPAPAFTMRPPPPYPGRSPCRGRPEAAPPCRLGWG